LDLIKGGEFLGQLVIIIFSQEYNSPRVNSVAGKLTGSESGLCYLMGQLLAAV
jgi:hypothetical protein